MKLEQSSLRNLYPDMSPEFEARMGHLLRTLPNEQPQRPRPRLPMRTALVLLMLLLALSTTAYALTRPAVLSWLLGARGIGSPQLEQTAQEIIASAAAEGITIRITGAVYDGSELAISYSAENAAPDLPVIIALDSQMTVDGQPHTLPHPEYNNNIRMVPSPHLDVLPAQRNPINRGFWSGTLPASLHGQAECAVTFIVYRPQTTFAVLVEPDDSLRDTTITDAAFQAEIADALSTLESFRNAEIYPAAADIPADSTLVDHSGSLLNGLTDSHLREITRITVPFTIDADKAIAYDFSGAQADFEDFTVNAASFQLTPLRTYLDVRLLPRENNESAARALAESCGPYTLTDDQGEPVVYSDMDYCSSLLPYVTCMDGQWVCRYLIDMPGLLTFPDRVGFTIQTGELLSFPLVGT